MLRADSHTTMPLILGSRTACDNFEDDDLRAGDPVRYCGECGWFCCFSCAAAYFEDSVDIAATSQVDGHYIQVRNPAITVCSLLQPSL